MGKFTIEVSNHRDAQNLHLLLTVGGESQGLRGGLKPGVSTPWADFAAQGAALSADFLGGCRLYVGYGSLPASPDPNSTQYYGWIEFSKVNEKDNLWINLSNVDIVGLPLALTGFLPNGTAFSLGYRTSTLKLIQELKQKALTGSAPNAAIKLCTNGSEKVIAPNIQFPAFKSFEPYLDELVAAKAPLILHTDTPTPAPAKVFTGAFSPGDTIVRLTSGSDTFEILKNQLTTEFLYRCDGGTVIYNGKAVAMNRQDKEKDPVTKAEKFIAEAVYTNSLFRNVCTGLNEGYFTTQGPNDSSKFLSQTPFQGGWGNTYAAIIHQGSNSYGYPYADGNLKTLIQAGGSSIATLTILKDDETGFYAAD